MADSFEKLLTRSADELISVLASVVNEESDIRVETVARAFAINDTQLLCLAGFHPQRHELASTSPIFAALANETFANKRNSRFIHDQYQDLSVNDVVAIYQAIGRAGAVTPAHRDVVFSRLEMLENQLEETINPVLIGSYRLEVRAIYEGGIADHRFARARLAPIYEQTRQVADEVRIMLETKVLSASDVLLDEQVGMEEKQKLVFNGLVPDDDLARYLANPDIDSEFKRAIQGA